MLIKIDDLRGPEIAALLQEHLDAMYAQSPPESVHALDLDKLRKPDITFWTAWEEDSLAGCGALKELDKTHGEIKSMRTAKPHLRKGVAEKILQQILSEAKARGYTRLSLETGPTDYFQPAHALYRKFGFTKCGAFGDYRSDDPFSVFMSLAL